MYMRPRQKEFIKVYVWWWFPCQLTSFGNLYYWTNACKLVKKSENRGESEHAQPPIRSVVVLNLINEWSFSLLWKKKFIFKDTRGSLVVVTYIYCTLWVCVSANINDYWPAFRWITVNCKNHNQLMISRNRQQNIIRKKLILKPKEWVQMKVKSWIQLFHG